MKKFILLLCLSIGSFLLPLLNVKAIDGFIAFAGVAIPSNSNSVWYSGLNYHKTQNSVQTYRNGTAYTNDIFQNERDIKVRTWDGSCNSTWITLSKNQTKNWGQGTTSCANIFTGTYGVDIKRASSGTSSLVHYGEWWLNLNLYS